MATSESCKDVEYSDQLTHVLMRQRERWRATTDETERERHLEYMLDLSKSSILPKVADHSNNFTLLRSILEYYYAVFPCNCVHSKQNLP